MHRPPRQENLDRNHEDLLFEKVPPQFEIRMGVSFPHFYYFQLSSFEEKKIEIFCPRYDHYLAPKVINPKRNENNSCGFCIALSLSCFCQTPKVQQTPSVMRTTAVVSCIALPLSHSARLQGAQTQA